MFGKEKLVQLTELKLKRLTALNHQLEAIPVGEKLHGPEDLAQKTVWVS
jgi:hypothetical protein